MDDRLLRALARKPVDRTPVWFMRQAGRYLPEYRALREQHALFDIMRTPDLAARVTLLPVERFSFDAAVLFSDLSLPLLAAGLELTIEPDQGPVLSSPIRSPEDVGRLKPVALDRDLGFVFEQVRLCRERLDVPLIGFAGAPFTLATYAVEGRGGRDLAQTRAFMVRHPEAWDKLLGFFADLVGRFLVAQHRAGAGAVQLFDSWVGVLNAGAYSRHVLSHSRRVFSVLREAGVPSIHFGTGNPELYPLLREAGGDAISIDWRLPLDAAWERIGPDVAIQGNLDPAALLASPREAVDAAREVLARAGGRPGHIFNLGHGVMPATPPEVVAEVVEEVHRTKVG